MWSLQRILSKRKTQRFVNNMINKYSNIRLSGTTKVIARKQRRIEATGTRVQKTNPDHDYGDQAERLTSSCCQTESERGSTLTMLGSEQSHLGKRHEQQQPQQDEAHLDHWRMSETQIQSDYGSDIPSTRLTRGLGNENCSLIGFPRASESDSMVSPPEKAEENQQECSRLLETDSSSSKCVESTPTSITDQTDDQSELSGSPTVSSVVGDQSPLPSSSTPTEAMLPRLRPSAPLHCVVPNCCDYFTSPHPHYAKEVIGMAKIKESLQSVSASTKPDTITESADNERGDNERSYTERGGHEKDNHEGSDRTGEASVARSSNEFEMWDYVCPQYARRYYANEWF